MPASMLEAGRRESRPAPCRGRGEPGVRLGSGWRSGWSAPAPGCGPCCRSPLRFSVPPPAPPARPRSPWRRLEPQTLLAEALAGRRSAGRHGRLPRGGAAIGHRPRDIEARAGGGAARHREGPCRRRGGTADGPGGPGNALDCSVFCRSEPRWPFTPSVERGLVLAQTQALLNTRAAFEKEVSSVCGRGRQRTGPLPGAERPGGIGERDPTPEDGRRRARRSRGPLAGAEGRLDHASEPAVEAAAESPPPWRGSWKSAGGARTCPCSTAGSSACLRSRTPASWWAAPGSWPAWASSWSAGRRGSPFRG